MSEYREYIAATKFNIGQDKETNLVVTKGTRIEYDGETAKIAGREYNFPKLESAIKARWLISSSELGIGEEASYQPKSANISMRHPTDDDGDPTIASATAMTDEERAVGTVDSIRDNPVRNARVSTQGGEEVVGVSFKTKAGEAAKESTTRIDRLSQNAIARMEEGSERNDKLAHFQEMERRKMEREIEDLRQQLAATQTPSKQVREGIHFQTDGVSPEAADTTSKDSEDVWDGNDAKVVAQTTKVEAVQEFDVAEKEARLAMARQMMPNFDWDFSQHWKTKLKVLKDDGRPLYICSVYAVETKAMKKHIDDQFPELNLGR